MKLIVISNSEKLAAEDDIIVKMFADRSKEEPVIVTKMFENGLLNFHLRKPGCSPKELKDYIERIPEHFHNRIVLHSHHQLAGKYSLKGIHISKSDKKKEFKNWLKFKLLKIKNPQTILTTSFSRASKIFEEEYNISYHYVFLTPIFNNLTGELQSGYQENTLKSIMGRTDHKVIARGGVTTDKVKQIHDIGFSGMAVHSTIWRKEDPLAEFIAFKNKFNELNIELE